MSKNEHFMGVLFSGSKNSITCGENFTDDILKTDRWILMGPMLFFIYIIHYYNISKIEKHLKGWLHCVVVL